MSRTTFAGEFDPDGPRDYGAELLGELTLIERWTPLLRCGAGLTRERVVALESLAAEIPQRREECAGRPRQTYYVRCWVFQWCRRFGGAVIAHARAELNAGRLPPPMPDLLFAALRTRNRKKLIAELMGLLLEVERRRRPGGDR